MIVVAALALIRFIMDHGNESARIVGNTLAIISGAVKGLLDREVNDDELVSPAIIAA